METMTRDDLEGPEFQDAYTGALAKVIEAKREDCRLPEVAEPAGQPGEVLDLMAALQESVSRAKRARGEGDVREPEKTQAKKAARKPARKSRSA
jgi:DNA end-binding protein Ku